MIEEDMNTRDLDEKLDEVKMSDEGGAEGLGRSRILYCRKCEGHGQQVILKGHAPICPYILCQCNSCEKLMNKRLKSFNKRNKEKIQLATRKSFSSGHRRLELDGDSGRGSSSPLSSGTCTPDNTMSMCNSQQPSSSKSLGGGLDSRSMSMGSMTVMSYDIWKAKCAAEKREREEREREDKERKASLPARPLTPEIQPRKRAHTFVSMKDAQLPRIKLNAGNEEKRGRYITLPTIPPMSVLIADEDAPEITPTEILSKRSKDEKPEYNEEPLPKVLPAPVARKIGANLTPPSFHFSPPVSRVQAVPVSTPIPQSTATTLSHQMPFPIPQISQPTPISTGGVPADQLLASMIPQSALPSSLLLQNSLFFNSIPTSQPPPPPPLPSLFSLLGGDLTGLLSTLTQPVPPPMSQSNPLLEVLQRTVQLQQLTASLSALSPNGGSPPLDPVNLGNPVLSQLINRQPLFSSTI